MADLTVYFQQNNLVMSALSLRLEDGEGGWQGSKRDMFWPFC